MFSSRTVEIILRFSVVLPRAEAFDFANGEWAIEFDVKVGVKPVLCVETGGDSGHVILAKEPRVNRASTEVDEGIRMVEDVRSFDVYETAGREDGGVKGIDVVGAVDYGRAISVILDGVGLSVGKLEFLERSQEHGG